MSFSFLRGGSGGLIGMVHLLPLPGSARYGGSLDAVLSAAVADAATLSDAGFDALIVENFGDAPFRKNRVEPATVAAMTAVAAEIRRAVTQPLGINVLRNDAFAALGVAAAVGASFIRVNILSGAMATDQGIIEGEAAELLPYRSRVAPDVAILADVNVKHARPLAERPVEEVALETVARAGADGLIVTGSRTGGTIDPEELRRVKETVTAPVLAGSGVTAVNAAAMCAMCDGIIVGSSLKADGIVTNRVDPDRARRFVEAARGR